MAVTILPREESFGQSMGSSVADILNNLAQQKAVRLQRRNVSQQLQQYGFSPKQANLMALFPPEIQFKMFAGMQPEGQQALQQQQNRQPISSVDQMERSLATNAPSSAQNLQNMFQQSVQQPPNEFQNPMVQDLLRRVGLAHGQPGMPGYMPPMQQAQQQMSQPQAPQQRIAPQVQQQQESAQPRPHFTPPTTPQMAQAERHFQQKQLADSYKLHKDELKQIRDVAARSKKDIGIYKQIKELNKTGKLIQGKNRQVLEKVGLENFFTNPETELAQKFMQQLTTGAAAAFNTKRLTNFEVGSYEKSLPRLLNTKEGLDAIADNRILEAQANVARQEATREITDAYVRAGQPLPFDLEDKIDDAVQPKLEALSQQALDNISKALSATPARVAARYEKLPDDLPDGTRVRRNGQEYVIKNGKPVKA